MPPIELELSGRYYFKPLIADRRFGVEVIEIAEEYVTYVTAVQGYKKENVVLWKELDKIWSGNGKTLLWSNTTKTETEDKQLKKREGWNQ